MANIQDKPEKPKLLLGKAHREEPSPTLGILVFTMTKSLCSTDWVESKAQGISPVFFSS